MCVRGDLARGPDKNLSEMGLISSESRNLSNYYIIRVRGSNSTKIWFWTGIKLATPGSAARHVAVVRHVTDYAMRPGVGREFKERMSIILWKDSPDIRPSNSKIGTTLVKTESSNLKLNSAVVFLFVCLFDLILYVFQL